MGGIITVGGPPEGGATMTVVIPGQPVAGARPAWEPPAALRGRTAAVAMSNPRLAQAMCEALRGLGMIVPESVEPTGVDVWVAEVAGGRGVPTGATIAVLGEDERGTGPLPVRRARLAEILVHALEAAPVHVAVPGALAQAPAADPAPADALVLVAEDNAVNRTLALRQLEHLGVTARGVATGPEAVEAVGRDRYDAVLMDRRMPEMDGIDATRAIRASERPGEHRTPIIAMTADVQPNDRELCLAAGMDDYLSKPITLQDLRRALAPWLAWQSDAAPEPAASRDGPLEALAAELRSRAAVVELIDLWLRELPGRRAALQAAVAAGDPPAISEVAHVLVSTSALFGATAASEAAAKLEAAARRGGAPSARELGALERELDAAAHHLRTWCATSAQPLTEP
jgi:CheY-like chemotaxis protein